MTTIDYKNSENYLLDRFHQDMTLFPQDTIVQMSGKPYELTGIFDRAIAGVTGSRFGLANLYYAGHIVKRDIKFAISILEFECLNMPELPPKYHFSLGTFYQDSKLYFEAIQVYSNLEKENFAPAISRLALLHKNGYGVNRDMDIYVDKLRQASKMGHLRSKSLLANHYIKTGNMFQKIRGVLAWIVNLPAVMHYALFNRQADDQVA